MIALLAACAGPAPSYTIDPAPDAPALAVGDVRADRAILWARSPVADRVDFAWSWDGGAGTAQAPVGADAIARVAATGLPAGAAITWTATASARGGTAATTGTFTTAPAATEAAPVRIAIGGDLGGQGYCRHRAKGYPILDRVREVSPTVFVANGDLIYADGACPDLAPDGAPNVTGGFRSVKDVDWTDAAAVGETFRQHWRYNRADPAFARLLATTPVVAQWDDHEVINDFGASWDRWVTGDPARPGYPTLVREGRAAFFDWWPIERDASEPDRLYRSFRWGLHAELFVADARSYRSPNPDADGPDKQVLGAAQIAWLVDALRRSDATWKIVSLDVPFSVATGDAFVPTEGAGGAIRERDALLRALDDAHVTGLVVVATDVHWARVATLAPDPNGDGVPLPIVEVISGPLRAWMGTPTPPDPSLNPTVRFEAGNVANFGVLDIDAAGALAVRIVGADGELARIAW